MRLRATNWFLTLSLALGGTAAGAEPRLDAHGDPLPDGALFRLGTVRFRHAGGISRSALSPDGKLLATASSTRVVIWDVETGRPVQSFRVCVEPPVFHPAPWVVFSPDSKYLAHVSQYDVAACVWDVKTGQLVVTAGKRRSRAERGAGGRGPGGPADDPADSLRFLDDGRTLVLCGSDPPRMLAFDLLAKTGITVPIIAEPLAFTADGKRFCAVRWVKGPPLEPEIVICSMVTGKEEAKFAANKDETLTGFFYGPCAFAPDGKTLAIAGRYPTRWDVATGAKGPALEFLATKTGQWSPSTYTALCFAADGKQLFGGTESISYDPPPQAIRRYDLVTRKELPPLADPSRGVRGMHTTPDGKTLISTSEDGMIRRWDLATGKETPPPDGYFEAASAAWSPDGRFIAVGDLEGRLDLWDARSGKLARTLAAPGLGVTRVAFSPDGKTLAADCADQAVHLWDPHAGRETGLLGVPAPLLENRTFNAYSVNDVVFSPDGARLLAPARKDLRLWDVKTAKPVWSVPMPRNTPPYNRVALSPDGEMLVTGRSGETAYPPNPLTYRDPATGKELSSVRVDAYNNSLSFSPDGRLLATADHDGIIRLWEPSTGHELRRLKGHEGPVWSVRFSHDGKWLVSGGDDGTARIWEMPTGKEVHRLVGHGAAVREVEFSPDGRTILTAGGTEVLVWDARPAGR
jgi:WD40 repeat protein